MFSMLFFAFKVWRLQAPQLLALCDCRRRTTCFPTGTTAVSTASATTLTTLSSTLSGAGPFLECFLFKSGRDDLQSLRIEGNDFDTPLREKVILVTIMFCYFIPRRRAASRLRVMAERAQRLADKLDEDRAAGR